MDNTEGNVNTNTENTQDNGTAPMPELRGYKAVCAKLGLVMCVYFICRLLSPVVSTLLFRITDLISTVTLVLLYYLIVIIFSYIIPLGFTIIIFKYKPPMRELYKKPRRLARAIGTFPAAYGLGYGVALITLIVSLILSNTLGGENPVAEMLRPATVRATVNITELLMMMFLIVVIAPLFEEYWVRGIFFDALSPYGTGIAIIISAVLFGLMHGTLNMFFYTTAMGLALGYIRYATGSLFTVTVLHAIVNSVNAVMLMLISLSDRAQGMNKVLNTIEMIYVVFVLALIFAGVVAFITKIPAIRKYKYPNPWTEISGRKKIGIFCFSIPVIISLILAFNEISGQLLYNMIFG